MQQPSVCVGIVTRNRAESLRKAIASALQQQIANKRM
jgi:glycosyltransferase involved in cell wall biosynthesis